MLQLDRHPLCAMLPPCPFVLQAAACITNSTYDAAAADLDDDEDGKEGVQRTQTIRARKRRKAAESHEETSTALSAHLSKCLAKLLQRFGAHAPQLRAVLALLKQLRFSATQATLKGKPLDKLLQELESATLKHTDEFTLSACGEAWAALLQQDEAPALQDQVQVRYRRMTQKIVTSLRPLTTSLKSKSAAMPSLEVLADAEIVLSRLERVSKNEAQSLSGLLSLGSSLLQLGASEDAYAIFDDYSSRRVEFDAFGCGANSDANSKASKGAAKGQKGASRGAGSSAEMARLAPKALFAGRLVGCLFGYIRVYTAQLILHIESTIKAASASSATPRSKVSHKQKRPTKDDGDEVATEGDSSEQPVLDTAHAAEVVEIRRHLLPMLRTMFETPSLAVHQFALEVLSSLAPALHRCESHV